MYFIALFFLYCSPTVSVATVQTSFTLRKTQPGKVNILNMYSEYQLRVPLSGTSQNMELCPPAHTSCFISAAAADLVLFIGPILTLCIMSSCTHKTLTYKIIEIDNRK